MASISGGWMAPTVISKPAGSQTDKQRMSAATGIPEFAINDFMLANWLQNGLAGLANPQPQGGSGTPVDYNLPVGQVSGTSSLAKIKPVTLGGQTVQPGTVPAQPTVSPNTPGLTLPVVAPASLPAPAPASNPNWGPNMVRSTVPFEPVSKLPNTVSVAPSAMVQMGAPPAHTQSTLQTALENGVPAAPPPQLPDIPQAWPTTINANTVSKSMFQQKFPGASETDYLAYVYSGGRSVPAGTGSASTGAYAPGPLIPSIQPVPVAPAGNPQYNPPEPARAPALIIPTPQPVPVAPTGNPQYTPPQPIRQPTPVPAQENYTLPVQGPNDALYQQNLTGMLSGSAYDRARAGALEAQTQRERNARHAGADFAASKGLVGQGLGTQLANAQQQDFLTNRYQLETGLAAEEQAMKERGMQEYRLDRSSQQEQMWKGLDWAAQYGSDSDFVNAYQQATGKQIDPASVKEYRGIARETAKANLQLLQGQAATAQSAEKWKSLDWAAQYGSDADFAAAYETATGQKIDPASVKDYRSIARDTARTQLGILQQSLASAKSAETWKALDVAAQFGSDQDFINAYKAATGQTLDPSAVSQYRGVARILAQQQIAAGQQSLQSGSAALLGDASQGFAATAQAHPDWTGQTAGQLAADPTFSAAAQRLWEAQGHTGKFDPVWALAEYKAAVDPRLTNQIVASSYAIDQAVMYGGISEADGNLLKGFIGGGMTQYLIQDPATGKVSFDYAKYTKDTNTTPAGTTVNVNASTPAPGADSPAPSTRDQYEGDSGFLNTVPTDKQTEWTYDKWLTAGKPASYDAYVAANPVAANPPADFSQFQKTAASADGGQGPVWDRAIQDKTVFTLGNVKFTVTSAERANSWNGYALTIRDENGRTGRLVEQYYDQFGDKYLQAVVTWSDGMADAFKISSSG